MSSIKDTMVDTSFVEEFAAYLRDEHGVCAWVVDGDEAFVPLGGMKSVELPHVRFYPFGSENGFGGFKCAADSETALQRAEPQITSGSRASATCWPGTRNSCRRATKCCSFPAR